MTRRRLAPLSALGVVLLGALALGLLLGVDEPTAEEARAPTAADPSEPLAPASSSAAPEGLATVASAAPASSELELAGWLTQGGRPIAGRLELRRLGTGEVATIVADAQGRFRAPLGAGWWQVTPPEADEALGGEWAPDITSALQAAEQRRLDELLRDLGRPRLPAPCRGLLFPWGAAGPEPQRPAGVRVLRAASSAERLTLDLVPPRRVAGRVLAEPPADAPPGALPAPLAGARVEVRLGDASRTPIASGPDGGFELLLPAWCDEATVEAHAPGRVSAMRGWWPGELLLFVLDPGGLRLSGRVIDAAGRPVAGADVAVSSPRHSWRLYELLALRARTGPDGAFTVEGLAPGRLGPAHGLATVEATLGELMGRAEEVPVGAGLPPVEVRLAPPTELSVTLDAGPTAELEVWHHSASGAVRTSLHLLPEGSALAIPCQGGDLFELRATARDHAPRQLVVRPPCPPVALRLAPLPVERGRVEGRVVTADGRPARELQLRAVWGKRLDTSPPVGPGVEEREVDLVLRETTLVDGAFVVDGFPGRGPVTLSLLAKRQRRAFSGPAQVEAGSSGLLLTLREEWRCRLRLRPVSASSGRPLPTVDCASASGSLSTRRAGDGELLEVDLGEPGEHALRLVVPGHVRRELVVVVGDGQLVELGDVTFEPAAMAALAPRWPDAPIVSLRARWSGPAGEGQVDLEPHAEGTFDLSSLAPGATTFRLTARRLDGQRQEATAKVTLVGGETVRVPMDLRAAPLLPPG